MPTFVFAQPEVNPHNTDGEAVFGYFENCEGLPPTQEDIAELFERRKELAKAGKLVTPGCLSWSVLDYDPSPRPNPLSEHAGLSRYVLGYQS